MDIRRRTRHDEDPYAVLGVPATADEAAITAARRRLAKDAHPDAGGSVAAMQRLNDAVDRALAALAQASSTRGSESPGRRRTKPSPAYRGGAVRQDHPSFTIEALPVEAFEGLVIVASWLGEVIDDDPPYLLEVALGEPVSAWCRLELVPDAGASTVSLTVMSVPGGSTPDVDDVRDELVRALNQLDWSNLDQAQPRPW